MDGRHIRAHLLESRHVHSDPTARAGSTLSVDSSHEGTFTG